MKMVKQTINIHSVGTVQIGGNSTQLNAATIQVVVQHVESSNAAPEKKYEPKGLLKRFLAHPLVAAVVGKAISLAWRK